MAHKYTNRLIHETSPYLQQHAHKPVDWHPWEEEAFARAQAENKPMLLSIGYSACHWCHVFNKGGQLVRYYGTTAMSQGEKKKIEPEGEEANTKRAGKRRAQNG